MYFITLKQWKIYLSIFLAQQKTHKNWGIMFIHPEKATKFEETSLLNLTLIMSNFKTKRNFCGLLRKPWRQIQIPLYRNFHCGCNGPFSLQKPFWKKKKYKCKRHYCQLLLFRTLVIVAFDMCEKSFTSACIPWVFLLLPHTNIHRYTHNTV